MDKKIWEIPSTYTDDLRTIIISIFLVLCLENAVSFQCVVN